MRSIYIGSFPERFLEIVLGPFNRPRFSIPWATSGSLDVFGATLACYPKQPSNRRFRILPDGPLPAFVLAFAGGIRPAEYDDSKQAPRDNAAFSHTLGGTRALCSPHIAVSEWKIATLQESLSQSFFAETPNTYLLICLCPVIVSMRGQKKSHGERDHLRYKRPSRKYAVQLRATMVSLPLPPLAQTAGRAPFLKPQGASQGCRRPVFCAGGRRCALYPLLSRETFFYVCRFLTQK